jgi:hypothetical protein
LSAIGTSSVSHFVEAIEGYLAHLKAEILEAQKMRMQVRGAKIIFLGGLCAYALPRNDALAMLVAPFAAFAFDCVIFGLTYSIQEIGAYIRDYIEPFLPLPGEPELKRSGLLSQFAYWETARRKAKYKDWGRGFAKIGYYVVTFLVCVVAFAVTRHSVPVLTSSLLLTVLVGSYASLIWFEFKTRNLSGSIL